MWARILDFSALLRLPGRPNWPGLRFRRRFRSFPEIAVKRRSISRAGGVLAGGLEQKRTD
jgi:hypothetical protein